MANTKNEVLNICIDKVVNLTNIDECIVSSNTIRSVLHISRSLASQYLNELWREGQLIKIQSHPTYFGFKKSFENYFRKQIDENLFDSIEDFKEYIEFDARDDSIHSIFGYNSGLNGVIDKIISGLKYPHGGLPVLIEGEMGTGKSNMVKDIFRYLKQSKQISENAQFIIVPIVFGSQDNMKNIFNAIHKCNDGILYIKNIGRLSKNDQLSLIDVLEKKRNYVDDMKNVEYRIIASLLPEDEGKLLDDLSTYFPIKCEVASFDKKTVSEREELVIDAFQSNSLILRKQIYVNKIVLLLIRDHIYKNNVAGMQNLVSQICASLGNKTDHNEIHIGLSELPSEILDHSYLSMNAFDENESININSYHRQRFEDLYISVLDTIVSAIKEMGSSTDYQQIIEQIQKSHDTNLMVSDQHVESIVKVCLDNISGLNQYTIPDYCLAFLNDYLYYRYSNNQIIEDWEKRNDGEVGKLFDKKYYKDANFQVLTEKLTYQLERSFNFKIGNIYKLILYIVLAQFNNQKLIKYLCIIVAHGRSTAHSIASAVNELLGAHVFDYFDMPLNTTTLTISNKVKEFVIQYMVKNDVILLVDMGSLEKLGQYLKSIPNKRIGIINNVSTSLALNVGNKVLNDYDLETILKTSVSEMNTKYTLIKEEVKKDAVIFVSENNINSAVKMRNIFLNSLPKKIDIDVIAMDIEDFMNEEYLENFRRANQILFVSGTYGSLKKVDDFIPIEELINDRNIRLIKEKLSKYLSAEELEQFQEAFIYNFSLENILDSISILDVKKLMNFVKAAVDNMQRELNIRFMGSTMVGLYMHLCCMVERLVTKEPIKTNSNLEIFVNKEKQFITIMRSCLKSLCTHYGIDIPISEISYLYDYIENDSKREVK